MLHDTIYIIHVHASHSIEYDLFFSIHLKLKYDYDFADYR